MKQSILFSVFVVITFAIKAQIRHDTCNNLQQYAGEWRYTNGSDTIRIYLRVNRTIDGADYIVDDLWGWHEYKSGNTIIESDYQHRFMNMTSDFSTMCDSSSITLSQKRRACSPQFLDLTGFITDYNQAKETKIVVATFTNSGTVMHWKQKHSEGYGVVTGATGMTLPKAFTLIKQ